jgi:hypothetical protein
MSGAFDVSGLKSRDRSLVLGGCSGLLGGAKG